MARPILEELSSEIVDRIAEAGIERSYPAGTRIFAEGDKAEFLPTVISGKVKMVRSPEPGKEVIIGTFSGGEVFAIPPALDGKTFPSTAVAMEETRIHFLPRDRFLELMNEFPGFSTLILGRACGILRDRADTISVLSVSSSERRVAKVLATVAEQENAEMPFRVPHRRQDLAEMAGLSLESAIRSARKLADRGAIRIHRGKIYIDDLAKLKRLFD
jgi:CRP-like cAMP-binding protein